MLKEKSLSRQSRETVLFVAVVNCQLLVASYEMEIDSAENWSFLVGTDFFYWR